MPLNQVCPTGASLRRMSLFVDSMNHGVPFRIDYLKLCEFAERWFSATCVARRFYSPVPRRADGQRRWAGAVRGGYEIVETPSNSDGDIVFDLVNLRESYDLLLLVSGDNGFADVLDRLGRCGKMVNVWNPSAGKGRRLIDVCADFGTYASLAGLRSQLEDRG
ncbi:MAG: NYN domain-containing protein [Maioricimonas sp. JB045]|uniref:NYN domain-containing protein n=1 Tax=Maioricimonas sp. JC845 TaxID=3232138 RepID=UPI00345895E7